jgi:hypothetical protein
MRGRVEGFITVNHRRRLISTNDWQTLWTQVGR